jgi:hypothetical protein
MILKVKNGMVWNEEGRVIAVLTPDATEEDERIIELGSEAVPIVEEFVRTYKPKTTLKTFEQLIEKHKI